jgi:hypothetical protein
MRHEINIPCNCRLKYKMKKYDHAPRRFGHTFLIKLYINYWDTWIKCVQERNAVRIT